MVRRLIFLVPDAGYFLGHRLALAKAARAAGWEVEVATAPDARQAEIAALGFVVHSLPFRRHGRNLLGAFLSLAAIWRLYRTRRPDLVHHVTLKAVVLPGRRVCAPAPVLSTDREWIPKALLRRRCPKAPLGFFLLPGFLSRRA